MVGVGATQQQCELFGPALGPRHADSDRGPGEGAAIESLAEHPHTGLVGDQHLQSVAIAVAEQEQVP